MLFLFYNKSINFKEEFMKTKKIGLIFLFLLLYLAGCEAPQGKIVNKLYLDELEFERTEEECDDEECWDEDYEYYYPETFVLIVQEQGEEKVYTEYYVSEKTYNAYKKGMTITYDSNTMNYERPYEKVISE